MKQIIEEFDIVIDFVAGYPLGLVSGDKADKKITKALEDILGAGADNYDFTYADVDTEQLSAGALLTHDDA